MCNKPKMPAPALPQGFNEAAYLAANPDVAAAGYGGAEHWQRWGHQETWRPGVHPVQQQSATGNFAQAGVQHVRQQKAAAPPPPPPDRQGARAGEVLRGAQMGAGGGGAAGRGSRRTGRTGTTMLTAGGSGGGTMLGA